MSTHHRATVDYDRLFQRLVARACSFMGIFPDSAELFVVDGVGKSATDFAMDTLLLFLDEKVSCSGDENAIFAYLRRVMEHDILDARKSATAKRTKKVEPVCGEAADENQVIEGLDDFPDKKGAAPGAEETEFKQRLYDLLEFQEPELYEIAYAILDVNALKPREIAEVIGTDTEDVQNRKKRLRTFLTKQSVMKTPTRVSR